MYSVLGGADFGAGFWDLTAGGASAGRARPRDAEALDEPGVGGQPRLADLRPGRLLDRLPEGLRPGDGDALRAALPRRGRDHPPRHRLRPARRGGDDRRGARAGRHLRALLGARPVLPRGDDRRGRQRPGQRARRPGLAVRELDQLDLALHRRARGRAPAPTWRPSSSPPTRSGPSSRTWSRRSAQRALGAGAGHRRAGDRRHLHPPRRRSRPLRRAHLRGRARGGDRVGDRRADHDRAASGPAGSRSRGSARRRRSARSSSAWWSPSDPTSCPAS